MDYYVGIDVSLELSSLCILDAAGQIVKEAKVASEPEALTTFPGSPGTSCSRAARSAALRASSCERNGSEKTSPTL